MAGLNRAPAAAVLMLLLVTGCGATADSTAAEAGGAGSAEPSASGSVPSESASPTASTESGPTADPAVAAFCTAVAAADTAAASAPDAYPGNPQPDQATADREAFTGTYHPLLERMEETAPPAVSSSVATYVRGLRDALAKDSTALPAEVAAADSAMDSYLLSTCGYPEIPAFAVDYEFDRLPESVPEGMTAISLTNDGQELHHIMVLRLDDGVDDIENLLDSAEDLEGKARAVALVTAKAGATNTSLVDLEPGRYAAVCFVPVGSKRGATGDGEPHHAEGMVAEFTVT